MLGMIPSFWTIFWNIIGISDVDVSDLKLLSKELETFP